jgi:hypothetical protein
MEQPGEAAPELSCGGLQPDAAPTRMILSGSIEVDVDNQLIHQHMLIFCSCTPS